MINPWRISPSHEDLFAERYSRLLSWSLHLTSQDRELAEDLLHDAFIHFTFARPDINSIQNLDGYLYGMLRNLHLAQLRREAQRHLQRLSIVEYESAETGLRMIDPRDQIQVREELRQVCHYACERKEKAWTGSVLILRFFHNYYPSEIAQILRCSRASVDVRLGLARREAKTNLESPQSLRFIGGQTARPSAQSNFARTTDSLLNELRQMIFASRRGDCLSKDQLEESYHTDDAPPMGCETLAHLVSCPKCLDAVNQLLGLPPLSDRYQSDALDKDTRPKGGPTGGAPVGGGGGPRESLRKSQRRAREVFEHKPQELCVSVNGYIQGSQRVASETSELTLVIDTTDEINFIEILSEQWIRLLLYVNDAPPPEGPVEQTERVELSDGRTLELTLKFHSPWPTLHAVYHDPSYQVTEEAAAALNSAAGQPETPQQNDPKKFSYGDSSWLPGASISPRLLLQFLRSLSSWGFWARPATVTALLALVLIAVLLFVQLQRPPAPLLSAASLLNQSAVAEETIAARVDQVLHRTINLEEKNAAGDLIARRKIEVWQSTGKGITARRLYDDRGQLIAGDWRRGDGVQTLYHHGARPRLQSLNPQSAINNLEDVWQLDPSAKEFISLIGRGDDARVETRDRHYVINHQQQAAAAQGLLKATLILSRADLHPVEQTLVVRQGAETREYRFVETNFERRPTSAVAPKVFEPEPELLSSVEPATRNSKPETATPNVQPLTPVVATADLEVEVLRLLSQSGADLGEQVSVNRGQDGLLHITGLVDTDTRKAEIARALNPVLSNPAVRYEIQTVAEVVARQQRERNSAAGPTTVEGVEIRADTFAAYSDLRTRLSDAEARAFASLMISRSHTAMRRAGALKRLLNQFSQEDLRALSPEARNKWLSLIRVHARAFQEETRLMRQQLQPIFFPSASAGGTQSEALIGDDDSLVRAVERLFKLGTSNERVISSAFATSSDAARTTAIHSEQFWQSLKSAEALAVSIQAAH
jgi:RNA polymerase sigma factor (sigma-70 family)